MSRCQRRAMIDRGHPKLSLVRQCALLDISRSSLYYQTTEASAQDLELMALMDRQYLKTPFYGSRRLTVWLRSQGHQVNRKRVRRLMQVMGLEAIYRHPNTSKPAPGHKLYPYLLRGLEINRVNQVWATDITYIPMARGFLYPHFRGGDPGGHHGLAQPVRAGLAVIQHPGGGPRFHRGPGRSPEQGEAGDLQYRPGSAYGGFTSEAFTGRAPHRPMRGLLARGIQVSMDGRGRCMDNVFVERLWRSIKDEEVYLKAYQNGSEARRGIGAYLAFYNQERPHQALGYRTPGQVFQEEGPQRCLQEHPAALSSLAGSRDIPAVDSLILASSLS